MTMPQSPRLAGSSPTLWPVFRSVGVRHGIHPMFLMAQCYVESALNPDAIGLHGEMGIAQFMVATWTEWGRGSVWNPEDAIDAQARYLVWLRRTLVEEGIEGAKFVLASYNWGIGNVLKAKHWLNVPQRVRDYATQVLSIFADEVV